MHGGQAGKLPATALPVIFNAFRPLCVSGWLFEEVARQLGMQHQQLLSIQ